MIPNHKGEIPVVILLLPFLAGIWFGLNALSGANVNALFVVFFTFCLAFILINLTYRRFGFYKYRWLGGTMITIILFLFGWLSVSRYSELNKGSHFSKNKAQYIVVKINSEPALKNGLFRFTADVKESIKNNKKSAASGTLLITIKDSSAKNLYYGDELLIPAQYNPIEPPLNPAEFNYKGYLANKNIYYQAFLYQKQYVVLDTNKGNPLITHSLRLRRQLVEKLKLNIRDTGAYAVASTLILGYKADLSGDIWQTYSKTGTVYVLSVSGAQVAIIYLLLTFALKFLDKYKYGRLIKAVVIICIIWYYAMLTGFSLAVCRVVVIVSMVIIGKTFSRYVNTLNILAVSAFLLLLYNPFYITEVGFQLSYIAVSAIIVLQPVVYKWLKFKNALADKLWALCSLSIAVQAAILPITVFYFHQFPVYFLISNLFVIIPSAAVMYLGILYLLLPQIPFISRSIGFALEKTSVFMNKGLAIIEHAPYSSVSKLSLTTTEYLLLSLITVSLFYFFYDKKPWQLKLSLFCTLLVCCSLSIKKINQSRSNNIVWLNLKKHKGIIFKKGNEAIVLADIKCTNKIYQYSIQPYLDSCQVKNTRLFDLNQDINTPYLVKKSGLVQFLDKRIVIFDGRLETGKIPRKIKTEFIYITDNPDTRLNDINANFDYKMLVVDGSNSDYLINQIGKDAESKSISLKILKRNNSLISISN